MSALPEFIGVCLSTMHCENRFFFIKALNKTAVKNGFRLMIFNSCSDLYEQGNLNNDGESSVYRCIPYDKLSAMVIFPAFIYNKVIISEVADNCRRRNIPVFSIDTPTEGCYNFRFGYSDSFERICRHVIGDHGVRRVFLMAGMKGNSFSQEREDAFRRVLREYDLPDEPDNIGYGEFWSDPTYDVMRRWFVKEKREVPEAIICANDTMAMTVSMFLQNMGVSVPEDCIVTGFDGLEEAEFYIPRFTTSRPDYDKMSQLIVDSILGLREGRVPPETAVIGFIIVFSQSCGCQEIDTSNVNNAVHTVLNRLFLSEQRQQFMCSIQSSISKMSDITELPEILIDKFQCHTNVFALNYDVFTAPAFGAHRTGDNSFSDKMHILFHRYFWRIIEPCTISRMDFIPCPELLCERTDPIVVCCLHNISTVMGYCVFQPEINFDEFEKVHTLMSVMDSAIGSFHSRQQIKLMNSQLMDANSELQRLSLHDFLTGLMNRRGFYAEIERAMENCFGEGMSVVIISADLDGLKYINDSFGHGEGDNAIVTVGRALISSSHNDEICARFGGDEFSAAALVRSADVQGYYDGFRHRFLTFLKEYDEEAGKPYKVEASIGCCAEPFRKGMSIEKLVNSADKQMYDDKVRRRKQRTK